MDRIRTSRTVVRTVALAACLTAGAVACTDRSSSITSALPPAPLGVAPSASQVLRGEVDDSGTVTFTSLPSNASGTFAPGIDANIYGRQNVDVHVYATAATVVTQSSSKTWTMLIGLRNLESYPIGSSQGGATPTDTSGIYLGFINGPTVTKTSGSCSSPCTMSITGYDGTGNFTAGGQPYVYWRQRLAAHQSVAGADTVTKRRQVQFTSPKAVTNFVFYMMVDADWPPPNQTSWTVSYMAATDSFPDSTAGVSGGHAKPAWKQAAQSPYRLGSESWSTSAFGIGASGTKGYYLFRRDSLSSTSDAFMQVNMSVNGNPTNPEIVFGFLDGTRMVAVGLTSNQLAFVSYGGTTPSAQVVGTPATYASGTHTFTLHKYKADSAVVQVDGTRTLVALYKNLPSSPSQSFTFTSGPTEFFGAGSVTGSSNTKWMSVSYGIGTTHP